MKQWLFTVNVNYTEHINTLCGQNAFLQHFISYTGIHLPAFSSTTFPSTFLQILKILSLMFTKCFTFNYARFPFSLRTLHFPFSLRTLRFPFSLLTLRFPFSPRTLRKLHKLNFEQE